MAYKLLLADDSITIQKVVELILSEDEYTITSVGSGQEAWEKLENDIPDVILADIEMPDMDGYELCQKVKSDPRTAHVPVVLLAGAFESFDSNRAREIGAADHVIKPFESSELISKLSAVLAGTATDEIEAVAADEGMEPVEMAHVHEEEMAVDDFDDSEAVEAEIEEPEMAVEAVAAAGEGDDDDLWGAEEIPAVSEEATEWEEALGEPVEAEAADVFEAETTDAGPAETDYVAEAPAFEEETEPVAEAVTAEAEEESAEAVAVAEETPSAVETGEKIAMEMESPDVEAVEEEFAEQIESQEEAVAPYLAPAPQVTVSEEDVREAVRAAIGAAMPSADDVRNMVRESVSSAVAIPDARDILAGAARDAIPDSSAVMDSIRESIGSQDLGGAAKAAMQEELRRTLEPLLKSAIEAVLWEALPETAERVLRQIIEEHGPTTLRNIFEKVAWETVPDVAERLITAEIEQIKAQH